MKKLETESLGGCMGPHNLSVWWPQNAQEMTQVSSHAWELQQLLGAIRKMMSDCPLSFMSPSEWAGVLHQ
jgi:hypothetical protein